MRRFSTTVLLFALLVAGQAVAEQAPADMAKLAATVLELGLGHGDLLVGSNLSAEQIEQARQNPVADTYPGTVQFQSGAVFAVADEKSGMILAVYERNEEASAKDVTHMVGVLMTRHGEPTTMPAHEKLIYWAYGPDGKVDEDTYNSAKASGAINILATVKFSSTLEVKPGMAKEASEQTGTIYYIVSSEPLLGQYISQP